MNLGVNCLSIKSTKPSDPLWNTDKMYRGVCVHRHAEQCTVLCQSLNVTNQVPGREPCLIQAGMRCGLDIVFMLRASQGIN